MLRGVAVARFNVEARKAQSGRRGPGQRDTPLQAVTLASIVAKEVNKQADQGKAARVLYNRLRGHGRLPDAGYGFDRSLRVGWLRGPVDPEPAGDQQPVQHPALPGDPARTDRQPGGVDPQSGAGADAGRLRTFFIYLPKEKETLFTSSSNQFYTWQQQYLAETGGG